MGTTPSTPEELGQALVKAAADNKTGDVKKMVAAAAGHDVLDVVSAVCRIDVVCYKALVARDLLTHDPHTSTKAQATLDLWHCTMQRIMVTWKCWKRCWMQAQIPARAVASL